MQTKPSDNIDLNIFGHSEFDIERMYHEQHDWETINGCPTVTGLENVLPDSWMNSLIQAMYHVFAPPVAATPCGDESLVPTSVLLRM